MHGSQILSGKNALKKCYGIFVASDAAIASKDKILRLAKEFKLPTYDFFTKGELGELVNASERVFIAVAEENLWLGIWPFCEEIEAISKYIQVK